MARRSYWRLFKKYTRWEHPLSGVLHVLDEFKARQHHKKHPDWKW